MSEIIRAESLRGFPEIVAELGGDSDALLEENGIDPAVLADNDAYLSYRRVMILVERAAVALSAPDLGIRMAERTGAGMLGPLAVAMYNAETVGAAIAIGQRFFHFHNRTVVLTLARFDTDHDLITFDVRMRRAPRHVQTYERGIATLHGFLATVCGSAYKPKAIRFRHEPLSPLPRYRAVFGIAPTFHAPDAGVVLARDLIDAPLIGANPQLHKIAEHFLESVAPPAAADDALAPRARIIVARLMRLGDYTQADLARAFGLHERTLQRRLKLEDTSFEDIRDDVRRELAQNYLAQRGIPLAHVAEMLGYAEPSAFTRASQRWFGQAPREVRKRMTG
ncbi:AraC family transcriptional regulator [Terricaulis silvestris]|uniref:Virulence-regulating protein VirS n=1 Tax=Terricaulis silvestris TaxID=2686094 RepID=A0A6I6MMF7_9CAUL|nr:AraC family transcriptional regulator [Terricaulis silvestris]QGZ93907.1 Virulence-regulating protein VirS [Terricaulis silvestris]